MYYHNITTDDMLNGSGLRVCLWCSGCEHHCESCQNPQTWNEKSGIEFDIDAENELFEKLEKDYISGITFTGGDPLHNNNVKKVNELCEKVKSDFPTKNIWVYTGYLFENIINKTECSEEDVYRRNIIFKTDVLVDGRFEKDKASVNYPWAGSTNQRVIDVQKTLEIGKIVLF